MGGKHDIYIIETSSGEFRVRPAVAMIDKNANKLKIRNLTGYTARLTCPPGFLNNIYHPGDKVSVGGRTSAAPILNDLDGYYEYLVEIDTDGAGAWVEAIGESAPSVIVDP